MGDSPPSLEEIACKVICEKIYQSSKTRQGAKSNKPLHVFDDDVFLHSAVAEQILTMLCKMKYLNNRTISFFNASNCRLVYVKLPNIEKTTAQGLRVLKEHNILDLEITNMQLSTINDIIGCLSEWSLENVRSLAVSHCTFVDKSKYSVLVSLSKLQSLRKLDLNNTELNKHGLDLIALDLPKIEILDISQTHVDDISTLLCLKNKLKSLAMHSLRLRCIISTINTIIKLDQLQYLDISEIKLNVPNISPTADTDDKMNLLLDHPAGKLPFLQHLDISGSNQIKLESVKNFLEQHPKLTFLGLMHTDACEFDLFTPRRIRKNLVITGTASENQIKESLKRYGDHRQYYVQKCFYYLFRMSPNFLEARPDLIEAILPAMQRHTGQFAIQMSATACLYNLTKLELAHGVDTHLLKKAITLTLDAMQQYPQHFVLQKNTLLTLCNDRILQDVPFDKFRCAKLVLNCLCRFEDRFIIRLCVAVCSILAARISTEQTSELGKYPPYMKKLLAIVREKSESTALDNTLKFSLSALWNLTDESPSTCEVFIEEEGIELLTDVLYSFRDASTIEAKVLGLFNNIAEVSKLRGRLMNDHLLSQVYHLLGSASTEVSYFAAGIFAHILSDGDNEWKKHKLELDRDEIVEALGTVVLNWQTPGGEMVAYRSFQPFFLLLQSDCYPVQLWSVWAIHHVCTKNANRYCRMLVAEKGDAKLRNLFFNPNADLNVKSIVENIFEVLTAEGLTRLL